LIKITGVLIWISELLPRAEYHPEPSKKPIISGTFHALQHFYLLLSLSTVHLEKIDVRVRHLSGCRRTPATKDYSYSGYAIYEPVPAPHTHSILLLIGFPASEQYDLG
jgi:hypothetical protein